MEKIANKDSITYLVYLWTITQAVQLLQALKLRVEVAITCLDDLKATPIDVLLTLVPAKNP